MEKTHYSKIYRILHWAIAFTFILLLITIFLRLTWMNKNNVAAIIQDFLKDTDKKQDTYLLPIKGDIRKKGGLEVNQILEVSVSI